MTAYPSLKRWLAAGLTFGVLGLALYLVHREGPSPLEPNRLPAQGVKGTNLDWHMYGGTPSRNMVNLTAKNLPTAWTDKDGELIKANIKWSANLGSKAYGGPVVAGGRVIIGTNNENPRDKKLTDKDGQPIDHGIVMCFDEATGQFQWQAAHAKLPIGRVQDWPLEGICSSPYIDVAGKRIFYVSNRCEVICADLSTGKAHWKIDMIKELNVFPHNIADCSPLLIDDHLWLITSNGVDGGHIAVPQPNAPSFIKIKVDNDNTKKGTVVWRDKSPTEKLLLAQKGGAGAGNLFKTLINRGELIQHGQWSNPSYEANVKGAPQVIFPGGDGWIYAFDPNGKTGDPPLWRFDCNPKDAEYQLGGKGTRNDFIATAVIYKNRVYIGVGQDPEHESGVGHLWCIDMTKKGDVSPELVTNNNVFPPTTKKNPNSAEVWHYGGNIANAKERARLQRNYHFGRTMSSCAIHDDIVYAADLNGVLHCLDANTGKGFWEYDTKEPIWSSPYYADGKIYLGTDANTVYVFEHGNKLKKLAENAMEGRVRATPIAANGVLYVMTENKLYAIKK